jgi:hypothetical protein
MPKIICPTEDQEQAVIIEWRDIWCVRYPKLELLYAIPNGGFRSKRTGVRMKKTGTKRGIPDLHLPVARGGFHSLYIELKRTHGGSLTDDQKLVIPLLRAEGNRVEICKGAVAAIAVIVDYLRLSERIELTQSDLVQLKPKRHQINRLLIGLNRVKLDITEQDKHPWQANEAQERQ